MGPQPPGVTTMRNSQGCRKVTERMAASPHLPIPLCKRWAASHQFLMPWNKVLLKLIPKKVSKHFVSVKKGHFKVKSSSSPNNSPTLLPQSSEYLPAGPRAPEQDPRDTSRAAGPAIAPTGGGGRRGAARAAPWRPPLPQAAPAGPAAREGATRRAPAAPARGPPQGPPAGGEAGAPPPSHRRPPLSSSGRRPPAFPARRPPGGKRGRSPAEAARPSRRQKPKQTAPGAGPRFPPRAAHPSPPLAARRPPRAPRSYRRGGRGGGGGPRAGAGAAARSPPRSRPLRGSSPHRGPWVPCGRRWREVKCATDTRPRYGCGCNLHMLASDSRPAPPASLNSFPTAPHCLPSDGRRRLGPRQPPPRGAGSAPSRGGAAALPARSRTDRPRGSPRGLPGPAARRDPKPGGGMPPLPRESHPGGLCSGVWQEHQLKKLPQSRQCLPWLGTRCGNASWLVLPRYRFCILTLLKKSVAKTNKNPKQLRGTTPMCLLLNLDADRTSLQCRKSNTASKGNIFLQLHC